MVQHPLQGGAAAQAVAPRRLGHAGEPGLVVQADDAGILVGAQDDPFGVSVQILAGQAEGFHRLKVDVQIQQPLAHFDPGGEVLVEGQAGEFAQQVDGVFVAVGRVVEHGVGVGENVLGGDGIVAVVLPKLSQPPLRNYLKRQMN